MAPQDDKGKFSTEIGQDVINEALKSVEKAKASTQQTSETEVPIEVAGEGSGSGEASASSKEVEELKAQLEFSQAKGRELMEKIRDEHEKMLRAVADLDNFKKRAQKEKEEVVKFGSERLLKDFLPVIDNFDRALEAAKSAADFESLKTGIVMTRKLFEDTLGKHGVKAFSAVGQPFDPRLHEAMQQIETADQPPNTVVMEVVRGFMLNDRLIRPALVAVAKAPANGPSSGDTSSTDGKPPENA